MNAIAKAGHQAQGFDLAPPMVSYYAASAGPATGTAYAATALLSN